MRSRTAARTGMLDCFAAMRRGVLLLGGLVAACTAAQTVLTAGLLSQSGKTQLRALAVDAQGRTVMAVDQGDGIRLRILSADTTQLIAEQKLGATGDAATSLATLPDGSIVVAGTSNSGQLTGTSGAAFPAASSGSNGFVACLHSDLSVAWLSFAGAGQTAVNAVAANAGRVVLTGDTYSTTFPTTSSSAQISPATASSGNGFVESFNAANGALVYATYLTGANGTTSPRAIALNSAGVAYVAGTTTASGYPTISALVTRLITADSSSASSGFLTAVSAQGDAFLFSTFVPGNGVTSIDLDSNGDVLLSGNIASGLFPISYSASPVAEGLVAQSYVRVAADGQSVKDGTLLGTGDDSRVLHASDGSVWVEEIATYPSLSFPSLEPLGDVDLLHLSADGKMLSRMRMGLMPFASIGSVTTASASIALTMNGTMPLAGVTLLSKFSSSLSSTLRWDTTPFGAPTTGLPSTVRDMVPATCKGTCQGYAAALARVDTSAMDGSISLSIDMAPLVIVRNVGAATLTGLQVATTDGSTLQTSCGTTLAAGAECGVELQDASAHTVRVAAANAVTAQQTVSAGISGRLPLLVTADELNFGVHAGTVQRTVTLTNLGTAAIAVAAQQATAGASGTFVQVLSDCTLNSSAQIALAAGASCHVTLQHTAGSTNAGTRGAWSLGDREVLLTGVSQTAGISASTRNVGFGRHFSNGVVTPRYLYLSNVSQTPIAHTPLGSTGPFTVQDACPSTMAAGTTCRVTVQYAPTSMPAADNALLTLDDGSSVQLSGEVVPPLTVTASAVNPYVSYTPASVTFGTSVLETTVSSETQTVTVQNIGAAAFDLALNTTSEFPYSTSCSAVLSGGASCQVVLSFSPAASGMRGGLLSITAGSGAAAYAALSGTAVAALPTGTTSLSFGDQPIGIPTTEWLKISQVFTALTATATGDFSVLLREDTGNGHGDPPSSLFSASSSSSCLNCWLGIQFKPTTTGVRQGFVSVSSVAGGQAHTLPAVGNGVALAGIVLSATQMDFGGVLVGSRSMAQILVLTNASDSSITVTTPAALQDFAVDTNVATGMDVCGGTLAANASCALALRFAPVATGTRSAMLQAVTTAGSVSAALSGIGLSANSVAFSPAELSFDNVPDATATVQRIEVTNLASSNIVVDTPVSSPSSFTSQSDCSTVAAQQSCSVAVTYMPGDMLATGTLTVPVQESIGGVPVTTNYSLPLNGMYTRDEESLQIAPGEMQFGLAGTQSAGGIRTFRMHNLGQHSLTLQLDVPRNFALVQNSCGGLATGAECEISVQSLPQVQGELTGTLYATGTPTDGAAPVHALAYLSAYGNGHDALVASGEISATGLMDFGQVPSGQTTNKTTTLRNPSTTTTLHLRRIQSGWPFLATNTCATALGAGQSCTVTVQYAPLYQIASSSTTVTPQQDTGELIVESDAADSPLYVDLSGRAQPVIVSSPNNTAPYAALTTTTGSLYFSSTRVGEQSAMQSVSLVNTGSATITIQAIQSPADFRVLNICGVLVAGAACQVQVSFTPQTAGTRIDALEISSNASADLEFVTLTGVASAATLQVSPSSLDFGSVLVGRAQASSVTVTNTGSSVSLTPASTGDFIIQGGSCAIAGNVVAAHSTCVYNVVFTPSAAGARSGSMQLANTITTLPLVVSLTGNGSVPALTATPSALDFGALSAGQTKDLSFTLLNNSSTDVTSMTLGLPSGSGFSLLSSCGVTGLSAGSSCAVTVRFTPTAAGTFAGTLSIASSDPASPLTISLTGAAAAAPGSIGMTIDGGSTSSKSVAQGLPATFSLALTAVNGFSGSVALTCASAGSYTNLNCAVPPAVVSLGSSATSTVTVSTLSASSTSLRSAALALLGCGGVLLAFLRRRRRYQLLAMLWILMLPGCGGGNTNNADSRIRYADTGTYGFTITASSTTGVVTSQSVTATVNVTSR